jgi:hypothetical protein
MVVGGEEGEGDSSGGHRGSTLLRPAASFCNIIRYQRKDAVKHNEKKKDEVTVVHKVDRTAVLWIWSRMLFSLLDPDPLVSTIKQK